MDKGKTRFVSGITLAGALMACGGASSGSSPDDSVSLLDGTWTCTIDGQDQPVTLVTSSSCTQLETSGGGSEADWLQCYDDISGNAVTHIDCDAAITAGTISVSADGNTLSISETGHDPPDAGAIQSFNATCVRTEPSLARCSADGGLIQPTHDASQGEDAGVTPPRPECVLAGDCGGDCARCQSGVCI
jgi:hypothetical protein